uniref:Uncharacterized protein n=1 Tax=Candidatus Kentrum sp. FW TaxID=2126338 RepID=A0A450S9C8_9GAMM|nr:MAG: hypothetical protein BECKFW1821A_GA0114235_102015 [Candidatus Kentron sp. FW]
MILNTLSTTNKIYVSIFREKAHEYRRIPRLDKGTRVRDTLYAEVLDIIAAYEYGFADVLSHAYEEKGRKLTSWEVDKLFVDFETQAHWWPLLDKARNKNSQSRFGFS